ncbi:hypothetical protein GGI35DRAFT_53088 [Trichoderma velutinum]
MAQLSDLPLEVKHMILANLDTSVLPKTPNFPSQSRRSELGLYASVSREWQLFFEQRLYTRLVLTQRCLANFNKLIPRQRQLVRYIWLRIILENYTCLKCRGPQGGNRRIIDMVAVSESICCLFFILSSWDTSPGNELALEISACSPSDVNHAVKGDKYLSSDLVEMKDMVPDKRLLVDDPTHGWRDGQLMQSYRGDDFRDVRGFLSHFLYIVPSIISSVKVVTQLVIRRTTRRFITVPAIGWILQRLPKIRHFIYEPWRPLTRHGQAFCDRTHARLILEFLPKTLKKFNWFEDFNKEVIRAFHQSHPLNEGSCIKRDCHASSTSLARKGVLLEQLTACYSVDAVPFFQAVNFRGTWPNLTTLSLTCSLFSMPERRHEIAALLQIIGMVAQRMPLLQTLDIWFAIRHHAAAFKHRVTDKLITISWQGTWDLDLEAQEHEIITTAWQAITRLRGNNSLYVGTYRPMKSEDVTSHAAAIRLLEIGQNVIHQASLEEISRETGYYFPS